MGEGESIGGPSEGVASDDGGGIGLDACDMRGLGAEIPELPAEALMGDICAVGVYKLGMDTAGRDVRWAREMFGTVLRGASDTQSARKRLSTNHSPLMTGEDMSDMRAR